MLLIILPVHAEEEKPEIPPAVLEKMEQLQKGELSQLEKIKLADELQRAGAKPEALALYEENLPVDQRKSEIPPEAYLNYGTALLEKGEEQNGLAVYDTLTESLDPKAPKTQKIKDIIEKNVVNFFKVQEQKKQQEEKEKKDKKENKENKEKGEKDQQQGSGGENQDQKDQQGQNPKDQKDKKQGDQPQEKQDKKDEKGEEKDKEQKDKEDKEKDGEDKEQKDKGESDKEGEQKKMPPPKMTPKLKQLMSDDRQMQLKVIEQGTRDMNRRTNRDNKDW